jgi:hypothetical protein
MIGFKGTPCGNAGEPLGKKKGKYRRSRMLRKKVN